MERVGETASGATGRGETKGGRRSRGIAFKSIIARGHVYAIPSTSLIVHKKFRVNAGTRRVLYPKV